MLYQKKLETSFAAKGSFFFRFSFLPPDKILEIFTFPTTSTSTTTEAAPSYQETNADSLSGAWLPDPYAAGDPECGFDVSSGFVVGGKDAKRGEFPFMALIGYW